MINVKNAIGLSLRSARPALWPAIIANCAIVTYSTTGAIITALVIGCSLSLASSFGFLINDCYDTAVDRKNKSGRLEYASEEELRLVRTIALVFLFGSLVLAALVGPRCLIAIIAVNGGLMAYTFYARQRLMLATALAGVLSSSPLWLPNIAFGMAPSMSQGCVIFIAILLLMSREMVFDVEDVEGDVVGNRRTFATIFSRQFAVTTSLALSASGILLLIGLLVFDGQPTTAVIPRWFSVLIAICFTWLFLVPLIRLRKNDRFTTAHFKTFTHRSRIAMLLLPILWMGL